MTRKIVSEMTYNVSMGTLNPTIPYHTIIVHVSAAQTDRLTDLWSIACAADEAEFVYQWLNKPNEAADPKVYDNYHDDDDDDDVLMFQR